MKNADRSFTRNVVNLKTPISALYSCVDPVKTNQMTTLTISGISFILKTISLRTESTFLPMNKQMLILTHQIHAIDNWKVFNKRDLHLIHLNINSLLSKIDELRSIAKRSGATVIGITESKLDKTVLDGEIHIYGYELIRSDRNRHGGGVACYIRNDVSFYVRGNFQ